jgi:hypothetical protein
MDCQQCGRFANMVGWTRAQANSIRAGHGTSSGGRDMCKSCWSDGPTERDVAELEEKMWLLYFDEDLLGDRNAEFMVEFA